MARITRVSTLNVLVPPTGSNSNSCSTRSSFTCMPGLAVPISSRKIVPPSACMNLPILSPVAPVNAPATWPNSSLSSSVSGSAPQATSTNGLSRRALRRWMARAISDLPVPLSPVISTVALRVGDAVDHVEHPLHAVVVADDVLQAEPQVELGLEVLVLFDARRAGSRPARWPSPALRRSAAW